MCVSSVCLAWNAILNQKRFKGSPTTVDVNPLKANCTCRSILHLCHRQLFDRECSASSAYNGELRRFMRTMSDNGNPVVLTGRRADGKPYKYAFTRHKSNIRKSTVVDSDNGNTRKLAECFDWFSSLKSQLNNLMWSAIDAECPGGGGHMLGLPSCNCLE